jgi:hypothetical protein
LHAHFFFSLTYPFFDGMTSIVKILRRAALDLLLPRVLTVMFMPMLTAIALWGGLLWWFGASWVAGIEGFFASVSLPEWLGGALGGSSFSEWLFGFATFLSLALLLLPAIYLTALFITSIVLMPMLVGVVAQRHYPQLALLQGGSFIGSFSNGMYALIVYVLLFVITLPFWLLGPLGVAISILLNAWMNQRLFVYDALAEHASARELQQIRREGGWPLYVLSALLGLLHFVPIINFFATVYMGLAFTHYGLDKLAQSRKELVG